MSHRPLVTLFGFLSCTHLKFLIIGSLYFPCFQVCVSMYVVYRQMSYAVKCKCGQGCHGFGFPAFLVSAPLHLTSLLACDCDCATITIARTTRQLHCLENAPLSTFDTLIATRLLHFDKAPRLPDCRTHAHCIQDAGCEYSQIFFTSTPTAQLPALFSSLSSSISSTQIKTSTTTHPQQPQLQPSRLQHGTQAER